MNELDKLNVNDLVTNQNKFALKSNFIPTGDQPSAIKELISGINNNEKDQVLLGRNWIWKNFYNGSRNKFFEQTIFTNGSK